MSVPALSARSDLRSGLWIAAVAGLLALVLFGSTLAPTVLWSDSAKYALLVHRGDLSSAHGKHAYHVMDGMVWDRLWSAAAAATGSASLAAAGLALRLHALSAVMAAITLALLAATLWSMTRSPAAVVAGCGSLAVSHIFWSLSVVTETYTHFTYNIGIVLLAWEAWNRTGQRGWLLIGALGTGLAGGVNNLPVLYLPWLLLALFIQPQARSRAGLAALALLALAVGFSYRGWLFAQDLQQATRSLGGDSEQAFAVTWAGFVDSRYHDQLFWHPGKWGAAARGLMRFPLFLSYQFLLLTPIGLWGGWRLWRDRPAFGGPLLGIAATIVLFTSSYMEQRRLYVLVSVYQIFALWVGYGVWALQKSLVRRGAWWRAEQAGLLLAGLALFVPPAAYGTIPVITERLGVRLFSARSAPYRDNARFFLVPWKNGTDGAHRFAREALFAAGPDGVLLADFTLLAPLEYAQRVEGCLPGVTLESPVPQRMLEDLKGRWSGRRVFLAAIDERQAYGIDWLEGEYEFRPEGPIYEVIPKRRD